MSNERALRTSLEIRDHLIEQLNLTLRRPGMYGGETAVRIMFDHLAYVEGREEAWACGLEAMRKRTAFTSTGVSGAFASLVPDEYPYDSGMASVYAESARDQGWLRAERMLSEGDHSAMVDAIGRWVAQDRMLSDVLEAFGPPSILFGGSNPRYGKTLGYLSESATDPMISFHLWNGDDPATGTPWPAFEEPVLLAVRHGTGRFDRTFAFTPRGRQMVRLARTSAEALEEI
ncbi:hypothetical protein [Actinocorallia populi]|uniref:hypothetical protein n=1 Tax=Actinocorallia populi TaxID=2079200 RepID=UPI000D091D76|nr:hypothetical protein [Actinocorallia populi]